MSDQDKPRHRWLRFSLRTLLVLVTLFGIWLGMQVKWVKDRHRLIETKRFAGLKTGGASPWSIKMLGEPGYATIVLNGMDKSRGPLEKEARRLFPEAKIQIELGNGNAQVQWD